MLGAITGDIIGSRFEWRNLKSKEFPLFTRDCRPTDDSVMTLAVGKAVLESGKDLEKLPALAVSAMRALGRKYPGAGYGGGFKRWLFSEYPQPYNSYGNGAAMRVSACGFAAGSLEEAKALARAVTAVTHNHPEGVKGAEAVAAAVCLARQGAGKEDLRAFIRDNYYPLDFTLDEIRPGYRFNVSCQGSVPQAIEAFLESTDFEDAIRGAVSIGGDSDTIAAITGAVAQAFYGVPEELRAGALAYLDGYQREILDAFEAVYGRA